MQVGWSEMVRKLGGSGGWRAVAVAAFLLLGSAASQAQFVPNERRSEPGLVTLEQLPAQAQLVYRLVREGGPFRYDKDGSVFGNRERLLPQQRSGYYREYTVETPGSRDRGARRLVCGGAARTPEVCYYTGDHYASFRRLATVEQSVQSQRKPVAE